MSEFDFRQKIIDGVPMVDLIEILGITPEQLLEAFDDVFQEHYEELKDYIGETDEDTEETWEA